MKSQIERPSRGLPLNTFDVLVRRLLDDARVHVPSELVVLAYHWWSPLVKPEALHLLPSDWLLECLYLELPPVYRVVSF